MLAGAASVEARWAFGIPIRHHAAAPAGIHGASCVSGVGFHVAAQEPAADFRAARFAVAAGRRRRHPSLRQRDRHRGGVGPGIARRRGGVHKSLRHVPPVDERDRGRPRRDQRFYQLRRRGRLGQGLGQARGAGGGPAVYAVDL